MPRTPLVVVLVLLVSSLAPPAAASTTFIPPVDAPLVRRFEPPEAAWGPGHRGVDFVLPKGTAIRAPADGTVVFAGSVAGLRVVTLSHGDGLETTYSFLSDVTVEEGLRVSQGHWIGRSGETHPGGSPGLHWGAKLGGAYVDPTTYLVEMDLSDAIRLERLDPSNEDGGGETDPGCTVRRPLEGSSVPPNDNVAVAVAGITSRTEGGVHADMYEHGPELLGYPSERVYRFSYRGIDGPGLHEPYRSADTYGDLNAAAERLRELLVAIGARHPGRRVDLVAHSQGGVVARAYLQNIASSTDPRLPQVEHLVTFSTPHQGAPLAGAANRLRRSLIGSAAMLAAGWLSDRGLPIPDPTSPAVRQLDPASTFIEGLAEESLPFGTRALTLSVADDLVVPADRTSLPSRSAASLGPLGPSAHSGIVASAEARGIARSFLRDAPPPCPSAWDRWGPRLGALIGGAEGAIPGVLEAWDRVLPVAPPRLLMGYGL